MESQVTSPVPVVPTARLDPSYGYAFASELRKALGKRNVTQKALAATLDTVPRTVWYWATGRSLPYLNTATKIADALDWPMIVEIVRLGRTTKCRACGRKMISEASNSTRVYCDEQCRRHGIKLGRQGAVPDARDTKIRRLTASIDAMCWTCEPTGVCSDGGCPLRLVSPLPLRKGLTVVAPAPDGRKSRWDDPAARERAAAKMRAAWAENGARRQRISDVNKARWAAMSDEERRDLGRRISVGRRAAMAQKVA